MNHPDSTLSNRTSNRVESIRRLTLPRVSLAILAVFLFALSPPQITLSSQPNVLMIAIDDLRPLLGCYGDPRAKTPSIDRLAAEGVVFDRAYCQYAKCGPSRLSIMTGLRPDAIGVFGHSNKEVEEFRKRRPDAVSVARWFKDHGYHARGLGKIYHDGWDLASDWSEPAFPGRDGEMLEIYDADKSSSGSVIADRWECPVIQSPDVPDDFFFAGRMTNEAIRILQEKREDSQPLFLSIGFRRPHLPFVAPQRYFDLHRPDDSWLAKNPLPPRNGPVLAWFNSDGYIGGARKSGLEMPVPPTKSEAPLWNGYEMRSYIGVPNHGIIEKKTQLDLLHAYSACVSYVDAQIGKILDELEQSGRRKNTIVALWSDHGWHLGEHSAWGKMTNYELATRVPLIIAGPEIEPARTDHLTELVDLYPTLCELAGLPNPEHLEGKSFVPMLESSESAPAKTALSQYARYKGKWMGRAIRTDRYRFVTWTEKKTGDIVERELYDHRTDPLETANLAGDKDYAEILATLESTLGDNFPGN